MLDDYDRLLISVIKFMYVYTLNRDTKKSNKSHKKFYANEEFPSNIYFMQMGFY